VAVSGEITRPKPIDVTVSGRTALLEVAQTATLAAALCYGAGWLFVAVMFKQVGVQPEDVGIGADFILVRATLAAVVLMMAAGGLIMPTAFFDWLSRGRQGDLSAFHFLLLSSHLFLFCATTTSLYASATFWFGIKPWLAGALAALLSLMTTLFAAALLLQAVDYKAISPTGPTLGRRVSARHLMAVIFVWILMVFVFAASAGRAVGDRIARGHSVHILLIDIRWVEASEVPVVEDGDTVCGLRLGEGSGFVWIYQPSPPKVIALPIDQTRLNEDPLGRVC